MNHPTRWESASRALKPLKETADRFYLTAAWRNFVECEIRRRFGSPENARCQHAECQQPERVGIRVFGDHIVELERSGASLDPRNVIFLCGPCQKRKTVDA
jgi:5-methylcytosine-specific restriction enzyme A